MKIGLVLFCHPQFSETFFLKQINCLNSLGHEVHLFIDKGNRSKEINSIKKHFGFDYSGSIFQKIGSILNALTHIVKNPIKSLKLYHYNRKDGINWKENIKSILISSHILKVNLDWLHFGFATVTIHRENVAKAIGARMAVSFRGSDIMIYPLINHNIYKNLWGKINKAHFISKTTYNHAISHGFKSEINNEIIYPAVKTDIKQPSKDFKSFNQRSIQLTIVSRLHWVKGIEYVINALSILNKREKRFYLSIIGEGNEKDRLIFTAKELGVEDHTVFHGKLSSRDVLQHLKTTDLFIQYSLSEGFCNAVIEAQVKGCICIVSDADGLTENVIDNKTGFIVEKQNPNLLAKKIEEVCAMETAFLNQIRLTALDRVKVEFNLSNQCKKFNSFYCN